MEYRHSGTSRDQRNAYASAEEIAKQNGIANFLFFDGHVEGLRDSQLTREMFFGN